MFKKKEGPTDTTIFKIISEVSELGIEIHERVKNVYALKNVCDLLNEGEYKNEAINDFEYAKHILETVMDNYEIKRNELLEEMTLVDNPESFTKPLPAIKRVEASLRSLIAI